jgi:TolA-binding protein
VVEFGPVTRIALDEMSELEYRQGDRTQRFALLSGSVHLKVDKLRAGQRFLVETLDAQVEVRGTVFDVALAAPDDGCVSPRTRVSVEEGVVEVRFHGKTSRVHAGESWPASCEEQNAVAAPQPSAKRTAEPSAEGPSRVLAKSKRAELASNTAPARSDAAAASVAAVPAASPKAAPEPTQAMASLLAEQNNLYAEAAALHRSGRLGDALSAYERLLARFPNGPLAESASVGRLLILAKSERARAKGEARRYLSRYPHGIASAEAQALLLEP